MQFYKANAEEAATRLYRFFSGQMQDEISVVLGIKPAPEFVAAPPLVAPLTDDDIVRERDPLCWKELPLLLEMFRRNMRRNFENPDDSLFDVLPTGNFGDAFETALLGGKVKFMGTRLRTYSESVEPLIRDYRLFDWRLPREDNPWLRRYLDAYRFMVQHGGHEFALAFQAMMNGLNLAVQFRGAEQSCLDIYDEPESLRRLLDYALDLHLFLYGRVEQIVGQHNLRVYGDHPLRQYRVDCQPSMSLDAYSLCKPGTLREWGLAQLARFNERVGGGILHIHENSLHIIEEAIEIPGLRKVWFTEGAGWPRPFELRWQLRRRMQHIPIVMLCRKDEFLRGIEERSLPGAVQYAVGEEVDIEDAKRMMEKARQYRVPARCPSGA